MFRAKYIILFIILSPNLLWAIAPLNLSTLPFSQKIKIRIDNGEKIIVSKAKNLDDSDSPQQEFNFKATGLHPKQCWFSLSKISRYEDFTEYIDYIKNSSYDPKTKRIKLLLSASFMPVDLLLDFKLDRITSPGLYHFSFDKGFLKGLIGEIHVSKYQNRCLYYIETNWKGPYTKFSPIVLETISHTLAYLGIEKMYRLTMTLK